MIMARRQDLRPGHLPKVHPVIHKPKRIRRCRKRGIRLPEGAIYVGRPTLWGNPFQGRCWGHAKSILLHMRWLDGELGALTLERMGFHPAEIDSLDRLRTRVLSNLHRLAGRDLACWCPTTSAYCHADHLLRLAPVHADYDRIITQLEARRFAA